jgi:hypothetical protein
VRNVRIAVRARTADGAETLEENALHVADGDDSAKRTYLTHVSSNARG